MGQQEGRQEYQVGEADLGDRGYMPPAVAGGKVYIATNNHKPRNPDVKGDKAVLLCFNEADGKFLWQIAHDIAAATKS